MRYSFFTILLLLGVLHSSMQGIVPNPKKTALFFIVMATITFSLYFYNKHYSKPTISKKLTEKDALEKLYFFLYKDKSSRNNYYTPLLDKEDHKKLRNIENIRRRSSPNCSDKDFDTIEKIIAKPTKNLCYSCREYLNTPEKKICNECECDEKSSQETSETIKLHWGEEVQCPVYKNKKKQANIRLKVLGDLHRNEIQSILLNNQKCTEMLNFYKHHGKGDIFQHSSILANEYTPESIAKKFKMTRTELKETWEKIIDETYQNFLKCKQEKEKINEYFNILSIINDTRKVEKYEKYTMDSNRYLEQIKFHQKKFKKITHDEIDSFDKTLTDTKEALENCYKIDFCIECKNDYHFSGCYQPTIDNDGKEYFRCGKCHQEEIYKHFPKNKVFTF